MTCEEFIPFVARAVVALFDSPRRLIATEELTNKLIDFYGPTPQNLTKLLLEEKKLQESANNGTSDAGSQQIPADETNGTKPVDPVTNDTVRSTSDEHKNLDNNGPTQATPVSATSDVDQDQTKPAEEIVAAETAPTNTTDPIQDSSDHANSNEGQIDVTPSATNEVSTEQSTSDSPSSEPTNDKPEWVNDLHAMKL